MFRTVTTLGVTQTLAWASCYYLPAVLAEPMARDLDVATSWVFGAFSASLLVTAALSPFTGRAIDRYGGRCVLSSSNLVFAAGLCLLGSVQGPISIVFAWLILGTALASGLYDAAFAALAGLYDREAGRAIAWLTIVAGFASTIGWPLSSVLIAVLGWRQACLIWAMLHLAVGLPLNRFFLPEAKPPSLSAVVRVADQQSRATPTQMALLAIFLAAAALVVSGTVAHLPRVLQSVGTTATAAIAASALLGPAQVGARLMEVTILRRFDPLTLACVAVMLHPLGVLLLYLFSAPAVAAFAALLGAGSGMLTIARGTLPLSLFGSTDYGLRTGQLFVPSKIALAFAPILFGLSIDHLGIGTLAISSALCAAGLTILLIMKLTNRKMVVT